MALLKKNWVLCLLLCATLFAALCPDAHAAPRVTWRYVKSSTSIRDGRKALLITIAYKNNSTDEKAITSVYDVGLNFEAVFIKDKTELGPTGSTVYKNPSTFDLWPGKETSLTYVFYYENLKTPEGKKVTKEMVDVLGNAEFRGCEDVKVDFKYSTRAI